MPKKTSKPKQSAAKSSVPADGRKAAAVVADRLRARVAKGDVKPGDALPSETVLMQEFGVARPTMREAIRILESEGLIKIQRGVYGGARVQNADLDVLARRAGLYLQMHGTAIHDLQEALSFIEPRAVALAARGHKKRNLKELRALANRIGGCDASDFAEASAEFHLGILHASGNRTLGLFAMVLRSLLKQEFRRTLERLDEKACRVVIDASAIWYPRLVDLIEAGDVEGAEKLWTRHRQIAMTHARRFVETGGKEPLNLFPDESGILAASGRRRSKTARV